MGNTIYTKTPVLKGSFKRIARYYDLTSREKNYFRRLATDTIGGGACLTVIRMAESAPNMLVKLAPALFSLKQSPKGYRATEHVAFDNRAWAVAKCGNPELAAEIFATLELEHQGIFAEIVATLVAWANTKEENTLLQTIFKTLEGKTSIKIATSLAHYFISDRFNKSWFDKKDIKKYGDSVISQRRDEIMRKYAEIMGS